MLHDVMDGGRAIPLNSWDDLADFHDAILAVERAHRDLTPSGFDTYVYRHPNKEKLSDPHWVPQVVAAYWYAVSGSVQFGRADTTYGMKHRAEAWTGDAFGISYISNGAFICGCLLAGMGLRRTSAYGPICKLVYPPQWLDMAAEDPAGLFRRWLEVGDV